MGFPKLVSVRNYRHWKKGWLCISLCCFICCAIGLFGKQFLLDRSIPLSQVIEGDSKDLRVEGSIDRLNDEQNRPPFIVILAQFRGGSSIISQVFNQNPKMFFLYEPLYVVSRLETWGRLPNNRQSPESRGYSTGVLRGIAGCNFTNEYVKIMNGWEGLGQNRALCAAVRNMTRAKHCDLQNVTWIGNFCSEFGGNVAIKVIRTDLESIRPLVEQDGINTKVIHLVRDPRGAAASRIRYYLGSRKELVEKHRSEFAELGRLAPLGLNDITREPRDSMQNLCNWMRANVHNASNIPDWLRDRYYLLKYEDFAESPVEVAQDLYRFVGLSFPNEVKSWLVSNTQVSTSNSGTFALNKNSRETAQKWMSELSQIEIDQVQAACLDIMKELDYKPYAKTS